MMLQRQEKIALSWARRAKALLCTGRRLGLILGLSVLPLACKDLTGDQSLPSGTTDPGSYNTVAGARGQRNAAMNAWTQAWTKAVVSTGVLSDEFQVTREATPFTRNLDQRLLPEGSATASISYSTDDDYKQLHTARGLAVQAIGQLAKYDSAALALRGELYAAAGYAELLLADLFCSGVPLSTLDFEQDYTYAPSSTTAQVYQSAIAKFDTALTLAADSARIMNLARVGKGRALLDLGQYAQAAQAVAEVPDTYQYQLSARWIDSSGIRDVFGAVHDADHEGENGESYISNEDPRSTAQTLSNPENGTRLQPTKIVGRLNAAGFAPLTVADGIEARLIEAEAALQANPTSSKWLTILNRLRTTGSGTTVPASTIIDTLGVTHCGGDYETCGASPGGSDPAFGQPAGGFPGYMLVSADTIYPAPETGAPDGGRIQDYCNRHSWYSPCYVGDTMVVQTLVLPAHTLWTAGIGGISGLAPLTDPAADSPSETATMTARVNLLFHERAEWLFATGHRQGDLRRLLRQYHRAQSQVYPTGVYPIGRFYGGDVTVPIPSAEYANPLYHGCIDRNS